jgi:3',5'-cyclic AMP phosphodiesterase CpdA
MRRIAHISDLHFGAEDPALTLGLRADLESLRPDLLIVSGDLTQRARRPQFEAAHHYLRGLPHPQLVVPGNHDIPLYDFARRFLVPLDRYCRYIHGELNPFFQDDELAVLGLNTARSLTWKSGRISPEQLRYLEKRLSSVPGTKFRIVVTHHPFIPPPGEGGAGIDLVGRAARALPALDRTGVDLLLAGHLHHGYTGDVRTFYPSAGRSIIVAQAGTATSHRVRHEPNAYNHIEIVRDRITITVRVWTGSAFEPARHIAYQRVESEWRAESVTA